MQRRRHPPRHQKKLRLGFLIEAARGQTQTALKQVNAVLLPLHWRHNSNQESIESPLIRLGSRTPTS